LLLVNSDKDKTMKIEDSCAHCSEKIHVELEGGKITKLGPETVWVQRGGG